MRFSLIFIYFVWKIKDSVVSLCQQKRIKMTAQQMEALDKKIDAITAQVVAQVPGSSDFGIMTACVIDGSPVVVSNYTMSSEWYEALEAAAMMHEHVLTIKN